ncbi:uncharacterized protein LOC119632891 [Glossina fuscipes]|uniref:Uncharacterized protein LOC119632891 n=1 Tax=Glossina fuscipes TaxID=7396 RepID=A0A8U0W9L6_9MUSC|nr:uncharacterized protein LOC119632891 [Glossina fuscipes]
MGANKSSPQTVPIDLAQLYVSPSVVSRIENVRRREAETSIVKTFENDSTDHVENPQQQSPSEKQQQQQHDLLGNGCSKLEDHQFAQSVEILSDSLSEALQRTENTNIEIQKLRNQLIACHRDHLGEPLCCAELVERFQDLVFREQYLNKLEVNLKIDESSE